MSHHQHHKKTCHTEVMTQFIHGGCAHAQRLDIDYGLGCALPARHSVVIRFIDPDDAKRGKKLVLQVCDDHFNRLHDYPALDPCISYFGSSSPIRMNFRRNRL